MLNTMTAEEVEQVAKVTDSHPEETSRMRKWLAENIAVGKSSKLGNYVRVTMTPVLAQLLLDKNSSNRPITPRHVQSLQADIDAGLWQFNSQPIIVSKTGELLDGQHRCSAVVGTGKTIDTLMAFGPEDEARFTMDTGRAKTAANFLAMEGKLYSAATAAALAMYLSYLKRGFVSKGGPSSYWPTKAEVVTASQTLRGFDQSMEFTTRTKNPLRFHSVLACAHFILKKKGGTDRANEFMAALLDGDCRKGDSIWGCREKLLRMTDRSFSNHDRLEILIKGWNAWREGRRVDQFKITGGKLPRVEV